MPVQLLYVVVAGLALVLVLLYTKHRALKAELPKHIQTEKDRLDVERETLRRVQAAELEAARATAREQAAGAAREQLSAWKTQEIEAVRAEARRAAREEAVGELSKWKEHYELEVRRDAVSRSRAVTLGKVSEHLVPLMDDFAFNPKDARFLGSPVDYVVFDGLCEGDLRRVVFLEVKTGRSVLNQREREVRNAVVDLRVEWRELRLESPAAGEDDAPVPDGSFAEAKARLRAEKDYAAANAPLRSLGLIVDGGPPAA